MPNMTAPKAGSTKGTAKAGKPALTEAEKKARAEARKLEKPEVRFKRVAAPRIKKALSALRRLETVGRSPAYDYTVEQANAVMKYIDGAVDKVRAAFVAKVNKNEEAPIQL